MSDAALSADPDADPLATGDDLVAPFQIEEEPVRGRIARLGPATVDEILSRHDYHPSVARLLGEALALATLIGSSLKFDGKIIVQVQGEADNDGVPLRFLVAEYRTNGSLRGYANIDRSRLPAVFARTSDPDLADLAGRGLFMLTIDPVDAKDRYQGTVAIDGDSLAEAAVAYFLQSEQIPTRIRVACDQLASVGGGRAEWRAGGALIQQIAGDSARGDTEEAWRTAAFLFETLDDSEILDPNLSAGEVLYRLFHEDGVRLYPGKPVETACTCSPDRIRALLKSFGPEAVEEMVEPDGLIRVRCEYCNKSFDVRPEDLR